MKLGVFGGSFDPVHLGHLIVAQAAAEAFGLDRVLFVPAAEQPFKAGAHHASAAHRLAMLEAALADDPRFVPDDRELRRPPPSYTVDTLRALRTERPDDRLFLLVGADAARGVPAWREAGTVVALATLVVLTRPGAALPPLGPFSGEHLHVPAVDISATAVRARVRRGASIRYLVPEAVREYIARHRVYAEGT